MALTISNLAPKTKLSISCTLLDVKGRVPFQSTRLLNLVRQAVQYSLYDSWFLDGRGQSMPSEMIELVLGLLFGDDSECSRVGNNHSDEMVSEGVAVDVDLSDNGAGRVKLHVVR